MSKTNIPINVKRDLWFAAHGRCEFEGCNKSLDIEGVTMDKCDLSNCAHIIADSSDGPRGDIKKSEELAKDVNNLMLMCPECHKYIDHEGVQKFGVARLQKMKKDHEERIQMVTGICPNKKSLVVFYGPNIGKDTPLLSRSIASMTIFPEYYPVDYTPVRIELKNSQFYDDDEIYWQVEPKQLERACQQKVMERIHQGEVEHVSLFAFAPQPLLVKLGTILNDKYSIEVYQKHREPDTWSWQNDQIDNPFKCLSPQDISKEPALIFAISANAILERVTRLLGDTASIWVLTCETHGNDMLQSKNQIVEFRKTVRHLLDEIKSKTTSKSLRIYTAMPVACAVELGRVRMPKADMEWILFDYQNDINNDIEAIRIN